MYLSFTERFSPESTEEWVWLPLRFTTFAGGIFDMLLVTEGGEFIETEDTKNMNELTPSLFTSIFTLSSVVFALA